MSRTSARVNPDLEQIRADRKAAGCTCGWWDKDNQGEACSPGCPTYLPPPPSEISGSVTVANRAIKDEKPNTASYARYGLTADALPVKLMGKDANRVRAVVLSTGAISIGKRDNVSGYYDPAVMFGPLVLENQDELWCTTEAADIVVTVIQERWSEA